jgi:hypothetical protein
MTGVTAGKAESSNGLCCILEMSQERKSAESSFQYKFLL